MVEIKTLEEEKKRSFYSILAPRVVKIEMSLKENYESYGIEEEHVHKERKNVNKNMQEIEEVSKKIEKFLEEILGPDVEKDIRIEKYDICVEIKGENVNNLIGYRGATINALQTLLTAIANKNSSAKIRVIVDVGNYREKREKTLEELAEKVSKTVIKTKKAITLEPMTAYERKIIHTKLQDNEKVKTFSKGEEPHRRIVIALK